MSITKDEAEWASNSVVGDAAGDGINGALAKAADFYGWDYVGGVADAFRDGHGYCTGATRWVVTYEDSQQNQDDTRGTLHPDQLGHAEYARLIETEVSEWFSSST